MKKGLVLPVLKKRQVWGSASWYETFNGNIKYKKGTGTIIF